MKHGWRIVREKYATTGFDGEGARLYGGRWNSPGTRLVYTSATLSLAALETIVHLNPPVFFKYLAIPIEFEDSWVEVVDPAGLPSNWTEEPPPLASQRLGDQWVSEARSAVLELPSAIVPSESNFLLNPAHPDFRKITLGPARPFAFDSRLL